MLAIPFFDSAAFGEEVTLDDSPYVFRFEWSAREECWLMAIATLDQQPLLEGVKIVLNENLLASNPGRGIPPGKLFAVAVFEDVARISRADLPSGRVELVYMTEAEVAAD